ncbi:DinB/UmuC family translesion DNA polymerase, partial [Terriglobus sp. ADX1]|uniref:DinB/UmuC family translesion DNA polymerase n=1 Tax=Terriglobus sp. ADX1 TaxID=2794063 RepID=UPI003ACB0374
LVERFGSYGHRLHELAYGVDHSAVVSNRIRKQISAEDTFPEDIPLSECEAHISRLAEKIWIASHGNARRARTVVLKLKTKEFASLTRSLTCRETVASQEALLQIALELRERIDLPSTQLYRLVGVGLSNFELDQEEPMTQNVLLSF